MFLLFISHARREKEEKGPWCLPSTSEKCVLMLPIPYERPCTPSDTKHAYTHACMFASVHACVCVYHLRLSNSMILGCANFVVSTVESMVRNMRSTGVWVPHIKNDIPRNKYQNHCHKSSRSYKTLNIYANILSARLVGYRFFPCLTRLWPKKFDTINEPLCVVVVASVLLMNKKYPLMR